MPRSAWLVTAVLLILLSVIIWWVGQRPSETTNNQTGILLANVPAKVCPQTAEVVVTRADQSLPILDGELPIQTCNIIALDQTLLGEVAEYKFFVAVPAAKPFTIISRGPIEGYLDVLLQLGDVDGNSVIDRADQILIEQALAGENRSNQADIDGDGTVTVLDYAHVTLNQGAGASRPDGKKWRGQL